MSSALRAFLLTTVAIGPLACARYEWVPDYETPACASSRRPTSTRPIATEPDSAAANGSLRGRAIVSDSKHAIPGASVTLLADPQRKATTDSLGTFTFTDVPPGTYVLRTRRIGYRTRTDTLHLAHAGSTSFVLTLDQQVFDGPCSGFAAVRVRKPWWKLW
jgi:hypothetical protein